MRRPALDPQEQAVRQLVQLVADVGQLASEVQRGQLLMPVPNCLRMAEEAGLLARWTHDRLTPGDDTYAGLALPAGPQLRTRLAAIAADLRGLCASAELPWVGL